MVLDIGASSVIHAINPANRQVIGEIRVSSRDEILAIVTRAHKAQLDWRAVPLRQRLAKVEQFRRVLYDRREELAKVVTRETGKPRVESMVAEIFGVLETCTWLQANAEKVLSREKVELNPLLLPGKRSYNVFEPLGVIAVVSPYNYPFSIPVSTILAALTAGNAVVFKPSPKTALVAQSAVELLRQSGFPIDLVGLVQGDIAEADALLDSDINRIMFTGSVGGGRAIMQKAAKRLIPVTLELGGKHAGIVLDDSSVDAIARPIVWAAFTNAGQACASLERLYVTAAFGKQLVPKLVELTKSLRLGDGMLPHTDVGPLIDESQVVRVGQQVEDAIARGATVLCGGKARLDLGGYFFEPTILANVHPDSRVLQEEIFGPVLPVVEVDDLEQAVAATNRSNLGLGASIWTRDVARGERIARDINAGMVWVNDGLYTHIAPDAPWGGIKDSGFGRMHSAAELRDLVYTKNIGSNSQQVQPWNYPYGPAAFDFVRGSLELCHREGIPGKLSAINKLIDAFRRKKDDA